jgi:hypothetical protein
MQRISLESATSMPELSKIFFKFKTLHSVFGFKMAKSQACRSAVHGGQQIVDLNNLSCPSPSIACRD